MKRAVRFVLPAALSLIGLLLASAPASAADPRIPLPTPDPVTLEGGLYCDFSVVVTFTKVKQYIIHQTSAPDGTTILKITGYARAKVTNTETDKSVLYNISGPGTVVLYPNGDLKSIDAHGPNLLWTERRNSFPGVPTISYTTGHVTVGVDASGKTTAYSLSGRRTDVCAVLAGS